jgi:hypothetical protein
MSSLLMVNVTMSSLLLVNVTMSSLLLVNVTMSSLLMVKDIVTLTNSREDIVTLTNHFEGSLKRADVDTSLVPTEWNQLKSWYLRSKHHYFHSVFSAVG